METFFDIDANEQLTFIQESARTFAETHIRPHVMLWDEAQTFPVPLFKQMGELGFMGVLVPEMYGGSGLDYQAYITIIEEISKVCGSIGLSVAAHNSLCTNHLLQFGSEEQKLKYLPELASGRWIGAWGLTETGTGSDAGGMATTAVLDGDEWVLNGAKNFITHAISADLAVVIARTGRASDKKGMTAFLVEKGTPGFTSGKKENKLGMRASETACLFFDNCRIPQENQLGEIHQGFVQSLKILDGGRISIAALSLGIAKGAYEAALKYAQEREQFGQKIFDFQGVSFILAEMATKIEAAELLTRKAGHLKNQGVKMTKIAAMAKFYASEIAVEVATDGIQIHGGYGYTKDFPAEKYYRDAKLCTIGEGTSEIQKLVIAREIK
jgi:alkylation response protein AidB-like acyl-CoA dehydrogenase